MIPKNLISLRSLLRKAKGQSQEQIISDFLGAVRDSASLIEDASVLIDHAAQKKLMVFNDKFLDKKKPWEKWIGYNQGVAGLCYRMAEAIIYPNPNPAEKRLAVDLVGDSPIENMVCVPIEFRDGSKMPFGVACFHNNDPKKVFSEEDAACLKAYVDILALALHHPRPEIQMDKNVFIVHGHDMNALSDLERFLKNKDVNPRVLRREKRSAQIVLEELENVLRSCHAGFVLITPDDEGRVIALDDDDRKRGSDKAKEVPPASPAQKKREKLKKRARENVIFETGLLFAKFRQSNRVSVLVKKPVELPSDLGGMFVDYFESIRDIEDVITMRLTEWGMFDSGQESVSTSMGVQ